MNYNFGQFRKSQINNYLMPLDSGILEDLQVTSALSENVKFVDKKIDLVEEDYLQALTNDNKQRSYYIRFKVFKQDTAQSINIKLINTKATTDNMQLIKNIKINSGENTDYSIFEIVISPSDNHVFDRIYFELNRELIDYNTHIADDIYGRVLSIEIERLDEIYNVIDFLENSIDTDTLKQIGVQGPPGLLMSINGEEIRIGRSGLYEINNGVSVSFIGFIIEQDEKYFVLDYQY